MQQQLEDLQIRSAHQEVAIDALNEAVARHERTIAGLRAELDQLRELLRELRLSPLGPGADDEPPPPHY